MTQDEISHLSVSNLKDILFQNHILAQQILERSELVNKVTCFIENEREERTRSQAMHMQETWEAQERERERERQREREEQGRERLRREACGDWQPSKDGHPGCWCTSESQHSFALSTYSLGQTHNLICHS